MSAIRVEDLGKRYRHRRSARTFKEVLSRGPEALRRGDEFWALRGVTFEVAHGTVAGVIGPNGAGKSTLLRLIAGVGRPDAGRVHVEGRVGAIFELGAGFHPELTGRESAILSGIVAGLTRRQVLGRLDDIVGFAGLERSIGDQVRTYSSGMVARLAFSIATAIDPDVLLVDEILAVGDLAFQHRCRERIRAFKKRGVTMLVVSHDPWAVSDLCDTVLWLDEGRPASIGPTREITRRYEEAMQERTVRDTPAGAGDATSPAGTTLRVQHNRFGSLRAELGDIDVLGADGRPTGTIASGDGVELRIEARLPPDVEAAVVGVRLVRDDATLCLDTSMPFARPTSCLRLRIARLDLAPGSYAFDVGLYTPDWEHTYDFHQGAYPVEVAGPAVAGALLAPPVRWTAE